MNTPTVTTTYPIRLFGGQNLGVTFDPVGNTLSVLNKSINISTLPAAIQAQLANAFATTPPYPKPVFGGDNVSQAVGEALSIMPAWRTAVAAALAGYVAMNPMNDPESWTH